MTTTHQALKGRMAARWPLTSMADHSPQSLSQVEDEWVERICLLAKTGLIELESFLASPQVRPAVAARILEAMSEDTSVDQTKQETHSGTLEPK